MFGKNSRAIGALIAIVAMASCNGGDATAPPPQSIDIAVSTSNLTVMCGTTGVTTATVTRGGDFDGPVDVEVSGLPEGVTAFLSPSHLAGTSTRTTITIVAEETAPPGSYTITVRATSSIGEATATYRLVLLEVPHFHMTIEPAALIVPPGMAGTAFVTITRSGGFTGNVALSVADVANGITVTLNPVIVPGTTCAVCVTNSIVSVLVANMVPVGNYTLRVTGSGDGVPTVTSSITLNVREPATEWYPVVDEPDLTVVRGHRVQTWVRVATEYELPGWAKYSLIDPPDGITADFEYYYDWGYPAVATIVVPTGVVAGRYVLTLGVTFPGLETRTTRIGLTVKNP